MFLADGRLYQSPNVGRPYATLFRKEIILGYALRKERKEDVRKHTCEGHSIPHEYGRAGGRGMYGPVDWAKARLN